MSNSYNVAVDLTATNLLIATVDLVVDAIRAVDVPAIGVMITSVETEVGKISIPCIKKTISDTTTQNLFTISGGEVRIISICGHITTAIEALTNVAKLIFTATGGAGVDMCAGLELNAAAVRKVLYITGTKADAMELSPDEGIAVKTQINLVLVPGIISFFDTFYRTGVIDWYVNYDPLTPSSEITIV